MWWRWGDAGEQPEGKHPEGLVQRCTLWWVVLIFLGECLRFFVRKCWSKISWRCFWNRIFGDVFQSKVISMFFYKLHKNCFRNSIFSKIIYAMIPKETLMRCFPQSFSIILCFSLESFLSSGTFSRQQVFRQTWRENRWIDGKSLMSSTLCIHFVLFSLSLSLDRLVSLSLTYSISFSAKTLLKFYWIFYRPGCLGCGGGENA